MSDFVPKTAISALFQAVITYNMPAIAALAAIYTRAYIALLYSTGQALL